MNLRIRVAARNKGTFVESKCDPRLVAVLRPSRYRIEVTALLSKAQQRKVIRILIFHRHAGHWKISILVFSPPPRAITNLPLGRLSGIQVED
jgi:hypothetical protein